MEAPESTSEGVEHKKDRPISLAHPYGLRPTSGPAIQGSRSVSTLSTRSDVERSDTDHPTTPIDRADRAPSEDVAARPGAAVAETFADLEHARSDWNELVAASGASPLLDFAAARVRSHFGRAAVDPPSVRRAAGSRPPRRITVVPSSEGLSAAACWNLSSVRGPIHRLEIAALTGTADPGRPGVAALGDCPAGAHDGWHAMLGALAENASPDLVELGPLPAGGPAAEGLATALDAGDIPFKAVATRVTGAVGRLPVFEAGAAPWSDELADAVLRSRDAHGPLAATVRTGPEAAEDVLAADAMLRRHDATHEGLDTIPEGRSLAIALARCGEPSPTDATGTRPECVSVVLISGDQIVARAVAVIRGDRGASLIVARTHDPRWQPFAPGRLAFGRLMEECAVRGVRTVETGPAGLWFHERAGGDALTPTETTLLATLGDGRDRTRSFIAMAPMIGRLPAMGPAGRIVRYARRWADLLG